MVAITRSDNMNPQHWRRVRVLTPKNTAPVVAQSVPTFEPGEAKETEYVLVPAESVDKLKGYIPVDRLTVKKILEAAPQAQGQVNIQDRGVAKTSQGSLHPLQAAAELIKPQELPCTQSAAPVLGPAAGGDKLEGYEPRYFLKEDGKDYDVP